MPSCCLRDIYSKLSYLLCTVTAYLDYPSASFSHDCRRWAGISLLIDVNILVRMAIPARQGYPALYCQWLSDTIITDTDGLVSNYCHSGSNYHLVAGRLVYVKLDIWPNHSALSRCSPSLSTIIATDANDCAPNQRHSGPQYVKTENRYSNVTVARFLLCLLTIIISGRDWYITSFLYLVATLQHNGYFISRKAINITKP